MEDLNHPTHPILPSTDKPLRRCQTIDSVRARKHRTALQHLQDMFWPRRSVNDEEHEQIAMMENRSKPNRF